MAIQRVHTHRAQPMDHLLIWVLRGRMEATAGEQHFDAGPGDVVMLEPGVPQEYRSEPGAAWEWLWVHFGGRLADAFCRAIRRDDGVRAHLGFDDQVRTRFLELLAAAPPATPGRWRSNLHADTCLYALLGLIAHRLDLARRAPTDHGRLDVGALQAHLHAHLTEPLTVEDLARHAKLSPSHFTRTFRSIFGTSPMRHVIDLRIGRAATLLQTTQLKLADVAHAVGYQDPYYFSRLFKKVTGVAPSAYRRRSRAGS